MADLPKRSKSADVAAQCGVVDEKVLQALQRIDDAVEAEERRCLSSDPTTTQLKGLLETHLIPAQELDVVYRSALSAVLNAQEELTRPGNEYEEYLKQVFQMTADQYEDLKEAAMAERQGEFLHLEVANAEGLMARDSCGTSDPYCRLAVVPKDLTESLTKDLSQWVEKGQGLEEGDIFTTQVVEKRLDPKWNETFEVSVDDVESKFLAIELWDSDQLENGSRRKFGIRGVISLVRGNSSDSDDFLGKAYIPLKGVTGAQEWYNLSSHGGNPRGRVQLSMKVSPRLTKIEEETAMNVYTTFFKGVLSAEQDANGKYTPTWNGRVSPIAQEMLELLAKRLGLGALEQGACQLTTLHHGPVHFPLALLEAVKLVHSGQKDLGFRAAAPAVKPWVTDLLKRLQDITVKVQEYIEDHQTKIDFTCKESLLLLEGHTQLLKVIYDIYPFIITMVIGKGVGHADKVLAKAVQASSKNWYQRLHATSQGVDQEVQDHRILAMVGTLRGLLNYLIWSKEELNPLFHNLEVNYFAETYMTFDLCVAPELEATAVREDLTELHRAMLQQTVREFVELGKQLPCETQESLKLAHLHTKLARSSD